MANTNNQSISLYERINYIKSTKTIPFDLFLEGIRSGANGWREWQQRVSAIEDENTRNAFKKESAIPSVTIAGKFTERYDNKIEKHSGFLAMDIDQDGLPSGMSAKEFRMAISWDKYVVAAFITISGRGVCVIFRVSPPKHREAFQGLCEYIYNNYKAVCDPTSINESRARYVSYDPDIYINDEADVPKFTLYPKEKPPKKIEKHIFAKNDFGNMLKQIVARRVDLTASSYYKYLRIAFGLVHQFSENGREYFHMICQFSPKYDAALCDKQYNNCLKHKSTSVTTISTLYYYAKSEGVELYSQETRTIAHTTAQGKRSGLNVTDIATNLKKYEKITGAEEIIQQVFDNNIVLSDDTVLDQLEIFIRQSYDLRRNSITRYIENGADIMKQDDFNSVFIRAKKQFDTLSYDLMDRLINSEFVPTYNPFQEFFTANMDLGRDTNNIERLFGCIDCPDPEFAVYFGKKWLVSLISCIHGIHSPLLYVLSGGTHGTGKTEFFRRMLPPELFKYYAESKLDAGKDDEILMTQKIMIMDDEMGGKSKKEDKRIKELTSKQIFSLREPYGRNNVDLMRLALLCGTTNENEILTDMDNRRLIVVKVGVMDNDTYNRINKAELIMEAYHLYMAGFEWKLNREDKRRLNISDDAFRVSVAEADLILKYFSPIEATEFMTPTEIKVVIEQHTNQRLSLVTLGRELNRLGFVQSHVKKHGSSVRVYKVKRVHANDAGGDDLPF